MCRVQSQNPASKMPTSYPDTYFPVLVQIAIALVVASALVALSYLIGQRTGP